ncbi:MAG: recombinase family protein [Microbacterium sp.]|jgi:DNA invertase Pin-like site-specific DNA recombinase|nr:recombinase family protein [Microbacterium sp.]
MTRDDLVDLYLRLSIDKEGKDSLERQEADLRAWAAREGKTVRTVWKDTASGYKDVKRDDFDSAVKAVSSGEVGTLAVWKLDRLSRRGAGQVGLVLDAVERAGGRLLFLQDSLDSTISGHRTVIMVVSEQARTESMNTSIRVQNKIAGDNSKGLPKRGTRPFGWHVDGITIREDEAVHIRGAVRFILEEGGSMTAVAHRWNEAGLFTDGMQRERRGRDGGDKRPARKHWTTTTVRQLLLRERNAGILIAHGAELPNSQIQPIITRQQLEALQSRVKVGTPLGRRATTLLGGIMMCPCGAPMHGTTSYSQRKGGPRNVYAIYKCSQYGYDRTQKHANIQAPIADRRVGQVVVTAIQAGMLDDEPAPDYAARLFEIADRMKVLSEQEERAEDALIEGLGDAKRVKGRLAAIRAEKLELRAEQERTEGDRSGARVFAAVRAFREKMQTTTLGSIETLRTDLNALDQVWEDTDVEDRQAIIRGRFTVTCQLGGRGPSRVIVRKR